MAKTKLYYADQDDCNFESQSNHSHDCSSSSNTQITTNPKNNLNNSILNGLNQEQMDAVVYNNGSVLVLAGAGSGKTRVLTTRIAWLVNCCNVDPANILAVTFTNKAAREMTDRIGKLIGVDQTKNIWVDTFHAISLRLLRRHYEDAQLASNFQIIDAGDQLNLIKKIIKDINYSEDTIASKSVQTFINSCKEKGLRCNKINSSDIRQRRMCEVYSIYEKTCNKENVVDFTELLLRSYELLLNKPHVLEHYRKKFKYILVDEFQDTNILQYNWLQLLQTEQMDNSIFAVGDDDQSIYSFRGAQVSNMQNFVNDFGVKSIIRLEQNYRSSNNILLAANSVISKNKNRIGKNLWTDNFDIQEKIKFYEGYTEEDEAYFVVDEIKNLLKQGISLSEIAILYRSNAQSRIFEQHLYNNNLYYKVYGGLKFFDRQEIKYVLSYLRIIINQDDNESFLRVVNFPCRGIGAKTIDILQAKANELNTSLFKAYSFLEDEKPKKLIGKFIDIINEVRKNIEQHSLTGLIRFLLEISGIHEHYINNKKSGGDERLKNIDELINAVALFTENNQSTNNVAALVDFLSHSILSTEDANSSDLAAVQLMTVHAAKGLEFRVVFVVGLEDGLFPHESCFDSEDILEEERRLMYVAITRAKERIYLVRVYSRLVWGQRVNTKLSRFVYDIDSNLLNNLSGMSNIGYNELMIDDNKNAYNDYGSDYNTTAKSPVDNHYINGASKKNKHLSNIGLDANILNYENYISHVNIESKNMSFKIGDLISHPKFNKGKIVSLNISDDKITADILFANVGKKTLDLNIATLTKL